MNPIPPPQPPPQPPRTQPQPPRTQPQPPCQPPQPPPQTPRPQPQPPCQPPPQQLLQPPRPLPVQRPLLPAQLEVAKLEVAKLRTEVEDLKVELRNEVEDLKAELEEAKAHILLLEEDNYDRIVALNKEMEEILRAYKDSDVLTKQKLGEQSRKIARLEEIVMSQREVKTSGTQTPPAVQLSKKLRVIGLVVIFASTSLVMLQKLLLKTNVAGGQLDIRGWNVAQGDKRVAAWAPLLSQVEGPQPKPALRTSNTVPVPAQSVNTTRTCPRVLVDHDFVKSVDHSIWSGNDGAIVNHDPIAGTLVVSNIRKNWQGARIDLTRYTIDCSLKYGVDYLLTARIKIDKPGKEGQYPPCKTTTDSWRDCPRWARRIMLDVGSDRDDRKLLNTGTIGKYGEWFTFATVWQYSAEDLGSNVISNIFALENFDPGTTLSVDEFAFELPSSKSFSSQGNTTCSELFVNGNAESTDERGWAFYPMYSKSPGNWEPTITKEVLSNGSVNKFYRANNRKWHDDTIRFNMVKGSFINSMGSNNASMMFGESANRSTSQTKNPTSNPSASPTKSPTQNPAASPSASPQNPTKNQTASPSGSPTKNPTERLMANPSMTPTQNPIKNPTASPQLTDTSTGQVAGTTMTDGSYTSTENPPRDYQVFVLLLVPLFCILFGFLFDKYPQQHVENEQPQRNYMLEPLTVEEIEELIQKEQNIVEIDWLENLKAVQTGTHHNPKGWIKNQKQYYNKKEKGYQVPPNPKFRGNSKARRERWERSGLN